MIRLVPYLGRHNYKNFRNLILPKTYIISTICFSQYVLPFMDPTLYLCNNSSCFYNIIRLVYLEIRMTCVSINLFAVYDRFMNKSLFSVSSCLNLFSV